MSDQGKSGEGRRSRTVILLGGIFLTLLIAITTQTEFPSSAWRTALYAAVGVGVTLAAAYWTGVVEERREEAEQRMVGSQVEIRDFLMKRVNSRRERTAAVISLCENAVEEFCAVTYFPVVGIQDDPGTAPSEYLSALEKILEEKRAEVTLVSVSCAEAREFAVERNFRKNSLNALDWVEGRLEELVNRFPERLTMITLPGSAITINVCHNGSAALVYFMSPSDDKGSGFMSNDPKVLAVAEGGMTRYASYRERERRLPGRGLKPRLSRSSRQTTDS